MTKKKFAIIVLITIIIIGYFFFAFSEAETINNNSLLYFFFLINTLIAVIQLIISIKDHPFSFQVVFWLFNAIFFGLAPFIQYVEGWRAWGLITNDNEMLKCNALILIWYICFIIGKNIKARIKIKRSISNHNYDFYINQTGIKISISISVCITFFLIWFTGIDRLMLRGVSGNNSFDSSAMSILTYHVFRNFVLYTLVITLISYKNNRKNGLMLLIASLCFLICCFPTGLSRYMIGAFYMGLIIHYIGKEKCKTTFFLLIFAGLVVVFPILNIIRDLTSFYSFSELLAIVPKQLSNTYLSGNFDAFQMIISAMHYITLKGYSLGGQLLGSVLFFIPRSIWPTKPVGSGELVITSLNQFDFSNVSMPLIGESYINFGIIGVVIFGIILGLIVDRVDESYWNDSKKFSFKNVSYPIIVFYFFFLQRGDLLSTGSYLMANYVMGKIVWELTVNRRYEEVKLYECKY